MTTDIQRAPTSTNEAIISFYKQRVTSTDARFSKEDLKAYVESFNFGTSFDTVTRALRTLRSRGVINYAVTNRAKGLFLAEPLPSTLDVNSGQ